MHFTNEYIPYLPPDLTSGIGDVASEEEDIIPIGFYLLLHLGFFMALAVVTGFGLIRVQILD